MQTNSPTIVPERFDEFAAAVNDANVARLAIAMAEEDFAKAQSALNSARQRFSERSGHAEILRREIFEHEAVAA